MFIGPDGKPITSQEQWDNLVVELFSSQVLPLQEQACASAYAPFPFHPEIWPNWPLSQFRLEPQLADNAESRDQSNFWNLLVATVPLTRFWPAPGTIHILDVGSGSGLDAEALHAYFGGRVLPLGGREVTYLGIDIDESSIAEAKEIHQDRPDLKFEVADATDLDPVMSTQSPDLALNGFEVIIIRHQNASNPPAVWEALFEEAWDHLRAGGLLMITSYTCIEHVIMLDAFLDEGIIPDLDGQNPNAEMPFQTDDPSGLLLRDHYVTFFIK